MKITNIENIKKIALGEVVELQGWNEEPFVARLKRPSILGLASRGKIPNELLSVASSLFSGEKSNDISLGQMYDIMTIVAKESLLEPRYEDLENEGINLTDTQLLSIYNYSQMGIRAVTPIN